MIGQCCEGVDAFIGWHFCFGNAWGNDILSAAFPTGYQTVLPYFFGTAGIDEFVLDYANRHMDGVEFLKNLPANQGAQVGVLDIRTNAVESPQMIADRIRKVVKAVPADKVTLSTDCGMRGSKSERRRRRLNSVPPSRSGRDAAARLYRPSGSDPRYCHPLGP